MEYFLFSQDTMKKIWLLLLFLGILHLIGCTQQEDSQNPYQPQKEWTKILSNSGDSWTKENIVHPLEWAQSLDSEEQWTWVYEPFRSESWEDSSLRFFWSEGDLSRYAIYDDATKNWIFDCFEEWGGGYVSLAEDLKDQVDIQSCKETFWNLRMDQLLDYPLTKGYQRIKVYTGIFQGDFIDPSNSVLWDIPLSWNACWDLQIFQGSTGYLYKYSFDVRCDLEDILYHSTSLFFTSDKIIEKSDLLSGNNSKTHIPFLSIEPLQFSGSFGGASLQKDQKNTFTIRCFEDEDLDPRFKMGWFYDSNYLALTTIKNKEIAVPYTNYSNPHVAFSYGQEKPYLWDYLEECKFFLSHVSVKIPDLPFDLLGNFYWAQILWRENRTPESQCKTYDQEFQVGNGNLCYIEANNDTNVIAIKNGDALDMKGFSIERLGLMGDDE